MDWSKWSAFSRKYGGPIIVIFHAVGVGLLTSSWSEQAVVLTPLNLGLLAILYLLARNKVEHPVSYALPALLGFLVEMIGTNTGYPFGAYAYSTILGPGIWNTPFMIGILWWVLLRSFTDVFGRITESPILNSLLTGIAMVGLDILIEPVAISLNFWQWEAPEVPLENYISWFALSFIFAWISKKGNSRNPLSIWVIPVLTGFFIAVNLLK